MEQQSIANGGLQYVPQIAVQYVYLDFDGELTSYNGEILTVDNVEVKDSSLTEERIKNILAELNARYAGQNIIFVPQRPTAAEYSTIYIGKTSAFDEYGNFAGLAETIDEGNLNKSDNAFVMLDSTASDEALISTISHETDHLLGTLHHGGEGLQAYAAEQYIGYGVTSDGMLIDAEKNVFVESGGKLTNTTVNEGGLLYILPGGVVRNVNVQQGGNVAISYGGSAVDLTIFADSEVWPPADMTFYISPETYITGQRNGSAFEIKNGYLSGFTAEQVSLYLDSGVTAQDTTLKFNGIMEVSNGASADNITMMDGAQLKVRSGGTATNISWTPSVGTCDIESGAYVTYTSQYSGSYLNIRNGGGTAPCHSSHITDISVGAGEIMYVMSDGFAGDIKLYCGALMYVWAGGSANNIILEDYGSLYIESGGVVNELSIVNSGKVIVNNGGSANVKDWTPCEGHITVKNGAHVTYASAYTGVYFGDDNRLLSHAASMTGKKVSGEYLTEMFVMNTGVAEQCYVEYADMFVFSGGYAADTKLDVWGRMEVSSGGTVSNTTLVSQGNLIIHNGGVASHTEFQGSIEVMIHSGGTHAGKLLFGDDSYGLFYAEEGAVIDFAITADTSSEECIIDDISRISGDPTYTVTITGENQDGHFRLADNAEDFNETITVRNKNISFGELYADGKTYLFDNCEYVLTKENNELILNIKKQGVGTPVVSVNTTEFTSGNVMVSAEFDYLTVEKQYSYDNKTWENYTGTITVQNNDTLYFRGVDNQGNISAVAEYTVSNIDRGVTEIDKNSIKETVSGNDITITWDPVSDVSGIAEYQIKYVNKNDSTEEIISVGTEHWTKKNIANGDHYYQIRAVDKCGNISDWSEKKSFTIDVLMVNKLAFEVPQVEYMYGCVPTCVGMLLGYYDRYGYLGYDASNLINGTVELNARGLDGDKYDMDAFDTVLGSAIASAEYKERFIDAQPGDEFCHTFSDSNLTLNTKEWNSLADYLGTGQYWRGNDDLSTLIFHDCSLSEIQKLTYTETITSSDCSISLPQKYSSLLYGLKIYVENAGYNLDAVNTQNINTDNYGGKFSFDDFCDEIDAGRAVLVHISDHTLLAYGYDRNTREIIFDDTCEHDCRMPWGGSYYYSDNYREMMAVTLIRFDTSSMQERAAPLEGLKSSGDGIQWNADSSSTGYILEYSTDNFKTVLKVETVTSVLHTLDLPAGSYQWRVRTAEKNGWTYGNEIIATNISGTQILKSDCDGNMDLFFANANETWEAGYAAQHNGILNGWCGTKEKVMLNGKNKLADIFEGSTDANILVMSDDSNGDALFVDDIYTALGNQARLSKIDEIRAGAGDDIVDMTSQRFAYVGDGVKIYGGLGDDTIWANNGSNTLFGDAGNDRIVGGSGNDVIVGGIGNDSMHGGGGEDIFCFGENWGKDTVEQLADGEVTLWFESGEMSNWNADTLTYTDGTNSVTVSGVSEVTLKFGSDTTLPSGCFDDAASEKIFEDKNKGMIA